MRVIPLMAVLLAALVFSRADAAEPSVRLSFEEFYGKVVEYYPRLKAQNASVEETVARRLQAAAGLLPRLRGIVSLTEGDDPVYVFGSLLRQDRFAASDFELDRLNSPRHTRNYSFAIDVQWPLFDSFRTISSLRAEKLREASGRKQQEFVRMETFLLAHGAYVQAVALDKLLAVVTQVCADAEKDVKQASDLKEKGLILGADYYAAKVTANTFVRLREELLQQKEVATVLLNILMGTDPRERFSVRGELLEPTGEDRTLGALLARAYVSRPDLAALDKELEAVKAALTGEKASGLPSVSAFATVQQDRKDPVSGGGGNFVAGVRAEMPLFDPAYGGRVKEVRARMERLEQERALLKDSISREISLELAHYTTLQETLNTFREMTEDALQAVMLTGPLYNEGRKSIADFMNIRSAYLGAMRGYIELLSGLQISSVRLSFLAGTLDEMAMREFARQIGG